jgi:hypothetical protein
VGGDVLSARSRECDSVTCGGPWQPENCPVAWPSTHGPPAWVSRACSPWGIARPTFPLQTAGPSPVQSRSGASTTGLTVSRTLSVSPCRASPPAHSCGIAMKLDARALPCRTMLARSRASTKEGPRARLTFEPRDWLAGLRNSDPVCHMTHRASAAFTFPRAPQSDFVPFVNFRHRRAKGLIMTQDRLGQAGQPQGPDGAPEPIAAKHFAPHTTAEQAVSSTATKG